MEPITIEYAVRPKRRSLLAGQVSDLFGLAADEPPMVLTRDLALDIHAGDLVLFTGASGSGKSSLLREAAKQLNAVDAMALELPDVPLIDALSGALEERLNALSACGLGEARLLLRTPGELSDGQRYRFRIAYALQQAKAIALDEFTAVLDRTLAKVIAFNLRKLVSRTGITLLAATTHEDIVDDLNPSVHVRCGEAITVERHDVKKKTSASPVASGSPRVPQATGRTSLGGITARTAWRSPAR